MKLSATTDQPRTGGGPNGGEEVLEERIWLEKRRRHEERLHPWINSRLQRVSRGEKHPVYDFLFDYYSHRPSHLLRWHPGLGAVLAGDAAKEFLHFREYSCSPGGIGLDPSKFPPPRRDAVTWILHLLRSSQGRSPRFNCFGLHEWAMVYRSLEVRHDYPLRLSPDHLAEVVESLPIRCSHFDAFRFFAPAARPLNLFQPIKGGQPEMEQRGCLHANMDLYKWAYKLSPWSSSELIGDAFLLAARIREIDMRASPYDFSKIGFEPIRIETPAGRIEYERWQREFSALGVPLRDRLVKVCERVLASAEFGAGGSRGTVAGQADRT